MDKNVWDQLKNTTADQLLKALEKDGWERDVKRGASQFLRKGDKTITIHYHPGKTYQPKLLKMLIGRTGWNEEDLQRLKLIKIKKKIKKTRCD